MKENSLIYEKNNNQTENENVLLKDKDNQPVNKKQEAKSESEYLKMFCKDISKINNRDECGWTPLYRTVISGILPATELLLNNGADPNIQSSMGETPLYQAVDMEKISHVNLLLQKGANPNIGQIDGLFPLHLAVNKQNILIIKELLKYKADPNNKTTLYEQTALHFATKNNVDPMILLILVQYNGCLFVKDKFGKTPLDYVSSEEMKKVIEKLKLENGEEISEKACIKRYNTPNKEIRWSESKMLSDSLEKESFIIKKDINIKDNIILKDAGECFNTFYRAKSGTISNEVNHIRNYIFKDNYNKINYNKLSYNDNDNDNINKKINREIKEKQNDTNNINPNNDKYNSESKEMLKKLKKNLIRDYIISKKEKIEKKINTTNKKIPNNFFSSNRANRNDLDLIRYATMTNQLDDDKSVSSAQSGYETIQTFQTYQSYQAKKKSIPILHISKIKANYNSIKKNNNSNNCIYSDKENKSTSINSYNTNTTNSKNESNFKRRASDFNTITDVKKFTLIPRDSRNTKIFSNYFSQKKLNCQTPKASKDYNRMNLLDLNDSLSKDSNNVNHQGYKIKNNKLYVKPKIKMNDISSIDKNNNSGYTFNIINNNTVNNRNFFNNSNRRPKNINKGNSKNNYNDDKEKGPLRLKKLKLQKKILSVKNLAIPFDKKKAQNYNRNSCNSNSNSNSIVNTFNSNTFNSLNNDSFCESLSQFYINKKSSNTSSSIYDSIVIDQEKYPIYDWLNEINLSCYAPLFIQKKIYDFQKIINHMKKGRIKMTPKDIYKIGIKIPGHIYRIFVKLELDSGLIDKKIFEIIQNKKNGIKDEEINILNNSVYNICGCCSLKERSRSTCKKNNSHNIYEIEQWLININMIKYKKNFIDNGFDKFEYFFLQMFGSFPIDSFILKNSIGIENEKDRDLILLQLQKDVKYLSFKSRGGRNFSNPKIIKNSGTNDKNDYKECTIF
jgi:ankyrin repeat protein